MKILYRGLGGIGQRHACNLRTILGDDLKLLAWRVRRLGRVITPTLQADDSREVETEYKMRTFAICRMHWPKSRMGLHG